MYTENLNVKIMLICLYEGLLPLFEICLMSRRKMCPLIIVSASGT